MFRLSFGSLIFLLSLVALAPVALGPALAAAAPPDLQAVRVDEPPVIDGLLEDPCWSEAVRAEGFYCLEVEGNLPSPQDTTALICYDDKALYVAVICQDLSPEDIASYETQRGGDVASDDSVCVRLDPWHTHGESDVYEFYVNAAGTQSEEIPGGSASKIEWRGDWQAAAKRTPTGWQAEMAIPFSILRFSPDQKEFGIAITRRLHQENLRVCFPNMGPVFDHTRTANLVGLSLPSGGQKTIYMPYVTADFGDYVGKRYDVGLDIQHKLPNGLTVLGSVNPDFKQIEDVVEPISFSYTERRLDDPRPFFVTGQSGFLPWNDFLYTRRIEDFDVGMKIFGKLRDETIGILDAVTFGEENTFAGAWGHRFSDKANAKLSIVSHSKDGEPDNLAYGLGGSLYWRDDEGFEGFWGSVNQTRTSGAPSGESYDFGGEIYHGPGNLQGWFSWQRVSPEFSPAVGYHPEVNYHGVSYGFGITDRYEEGEIEEKGWYLHGDYKPYLEGGGLYESTFSPNYKWEWRDGRRLRLDCTNGRREGTDRSDVSIDYEWKRKDTYRQGGIYYLVGNRRGGEYKFFSLEQGFRPNDRVALRLDFSYSDLAEPAAEAGYDYLGILTGTYFLSDEKSVSARLIQRETGFSAYASYRQVVRKGMDMYVILGDPDPERTGFTERLVVKFIWAF